MNYIINVSQSVNPVVKSLIFEHHYIGTLARGCPFVFELINPETGEIIGCAQVGICAGRLANKKQVKEIRRFVLIPGCPKNTASYFLSKIIRWFKTNTGVKTIISYADQNENHKGTIYKAANFRFVGSTKRTEVIRYKQKDYHLRTVYGSGGTTLTGVNILQMLREGKARRVYLKPKLKFEYKLTA